MRSTNHSVSYPIRSFAVTSLIAGIAAIAALPACSSPSSTAGSDQAVVADAAVSPDLTWVSSDPIILNRPYDPQVPAGYDPSVATPLVIYLHGYRSTPFLDEGWFKFGHLVDTAGYLYVAAVGSKDMNGYPHWNDNKTPGDTDDVAYLDAVIADMKARFHVDPKKVYVIGHSNGSAMAYRYACDRSTTVASVVPMAGDIDLSTCKPTDKVGVLHINGDKDPNWPGTPPVRDSPVFWAMQDGCDATSDTSSPPEDYDMNQPGAETHIEKWLNCKNGTDVQLWVVGGADHHPIYNDSWPPAVWAWLKAHPKQ